jgi:hypothetical protein
VDGFDVGSVRSNAGEATGTTLAIVHHPSRGSARAPRAHRVHRSVPQCTATIAMPAARDAGYDSARHPLPPFENDA